MTTEKLEAMLAEILAKLEAMPVLGTPPPTPSSSSSIPTAAIDIAEDLERGAVGASLSFPTAASTSSPTSEDRELALFASSDDGERALAISTNSELCLLFGADADGGNVDRLSRLPDLLLRDVVSRLPVKDAARTAVLSRRWRPLWRAGPSASLVRPDPISPMLFPDEDYDIDDICAHAAADKLFHFTTQDEKLTVEHEKAQIEAQPFFLMVQFEQDAVGSAHIHSKRRRGRGPRRRRRPPRLLVRGRRPRLRARALLPQTGPVHHQVRALRRRRRERACGTLHHALPQPHRGLRQRLSRAPCSPAGVADHASKLGTLSSELSQEVAQRRQHRSHGTLQGDARQVFDAWPHHSDRPAPASSTSSMSTSTSMLLVGATITLSTYINHRQGNRIPKPPWSLGTELFRSWFGRLQLISGSLLEAPPWGSDYTSWEQWMYRYAYVPMTMIISQLASAQDTKVNSPFTTTEHLPKLNVMCSLLCLDASTGADQVVVVFFLVKEEFKGVLSLVKSAEVILPHLLVMIVQLAMSVNSKWSTLAGSVRLRPKPWPSYCHYSSYPVTFDSSIMLLSTDIIISMRLLHISNDTLSGPCTVLLQTSASSATASGQDANLNIPVLLLTQQVVCFLFALVLVKSAGDESMLYCFQFLQNAARVDDGNSRGVIDLMLPKFYQIWLYTEIVAAGLFMLLNGEFCFITDWMHHQISIIDLSPSPENYRVISRVYMPSALAALILVRSYIHLVLCKVLSGVSWEFEPWPPPIQRLRMHLVSTYAFELDGNFAQFDLMKGNLTHGHFQLLIHAIGFMSYSAPDRIKSRWLLWTNMSAYQLFILVWLLPSYKEPLGLTPITSSKDTCSVWTSLLYFASTLSEKVELEDHYQNLLPLHSTAVCWKQLQLHFLVVNQFITEGSEELQLKLWIWSTFRQPDSCVHLRTYMMMIKSWLQAILHSDQVSRKLTAWGQAVFLGGENVTYLLIYLLVGSMKWPGLVVGWTFRLDGLRQVTRYKGAAVPSEKVSKDQNPNPAAASSARVEASASSRLASARFPFTLPLPPIHVPRNF